jgi:hypothetical protein
MNASSPVIETIGYLQKEVALTTVSNNILTNTFVLEALQPFPGYFGKNLPDATHPRSLFLVLKKPYSFEELAHIIKRIKKEFAQDYNATVAEIFLKSSTLPCIRIKYLQRFSFIPELQKLLQGHGIKFHSSCHLDAKALVKVDKTFYVREEKEGMYRDLEEASKCYIDLPRLITWRQFESITHDLKNNLENNLFDAALGVFYRKSGVVDMVRIYDKEKTPDRMKLLRQMYWRRVERLFRE